MPMALLAGMPAGEYLRLKSTVRCTVGSAKDKMARVTLGDVHFVSTRQPLNAQFCDAFPERPHDDLAFLNFKHLTHITSCSKEAAGWDVAASSDV